MDQSNASEVSTVSGTGQSLSGEVRQERISGIAAILFGLGQVTIAFTLTGMLESVIPFLVVLIGGMVLLDGGLSLVRGRTPFVSEWQGGEQIDWATTVVRAVFGVGVLVAALWFAF